MSEALEKIDLALLIEELDGVLDPILLRVLGVLTAANLLPSAATGQSQII